MPCSDDDSFASLTRREVHRHAGWWDGRSPAARPSRPRTTGSPNGNGCDVDQRAGDSPTGETSFRGPTGISRIPPARPALRGKRAQPSALALRTAQETACAPLTAIARPRATARRGASGRKRVRAGRSLALRRSWGAADRRCCRREHPRFRACSTLERVRCGVRAGMRKPMPGRPGFGAACIGRGQPGRDAAAVGLAVSSEAQILDGDDRAGTEHGDSRAGRVGDEHPRFAAGSALLP